MFSHSKHNSALPNPTHGGLEFLMSNEEAAEDLKQLFKEATKERIVTLKKLLVNTIKINPCILPYLCCVCIRLGSVIL